MPELPEVETTLRGIENSILNQKITEMIVRHYGLRWPIPKNLPNEVKDRKVRKLYRRGKYLLFEMDNGTLILHLGMSGSLRLVDGSIPPEKHDHVDMVFNKRILRFRDPRRFGALLWTDEEVNCHPLFRHLGVEPLEKNFTSDYLLACAKKRNVAIKSFLMNHTIVVGIGNIYATESLFAANIHPEKSAKRVTREEFEKLIIEIRKILRAAIKKGGTTLKDFSNSSGKPGYFAFSLKVYGRGGEPCVNCQKTLKEKKIGQRSTVYCTNCQK